MQGEDSSYDEDEHEGLEVSFHETIDLDDFVHPSEAYLHEAALTRRPKRAGRWLPRLIEDGEELYVLEGNSELVCLLRSGITEAEVVVIKAGSAPDELKETLYHVGITQRLGVFTLQDLSLRVLDAATYGRIDSENDVGKRAELLEEYVSNRPS